MKAFIKNIERLESSHYGNPRFQLELWDWDSETTKFVRTAPNCSIAYKICASWEGREVEYESKPYYGNETFTKLEVVEKIK